MTSQEKAFRDFAKFAGGLKGDEKSEAQTFLFHLLEAFGHDGNTLPEGCTFEYRVHFPGERTKYADLVWPGRALIEMKSRGAKLSQHYQQTFDYWLILTAILQAASEREKRAALEILLKYFGYTFAEGRVQRLKGARRKRC